jgi:uncharacterized protein YfbU (UPF0304 family)
MHYAILMDYPVEFEKKRVLAEFANITAELMHTVEDLIDKLTSYAVWVKKKDEGEVRRSQMVKFREATVDRLLKIVKLMAELNAMYNEFVDSVKAVLSVEETE